MIVETMGEGLSEELAVRAVKEANIPPERAPAFLKDLAQKVREVRAAKTAISDLNDASPLPAVEDVRARLRRLESALATVEDELADGELFRFFFGLGLARSAKDGNTPTAEAHLFRFFPTRRVWFRARVKTWRASAAFLLSQAHRGGGSPAKLSAKWNVADSAFQLIQDHGDSEPTLSVGKPFYELAAIIGEAAGVPGGLAGFDAACREVHKERRLSQPPS